MERNKEFMQDMIYSSTRKEAASGSVMEEGRALWRRVGSRRRRSATPRELPREPTSRADEGRRGSAVSPTRAASSSPVRAPGGHQQRSSSISVPRASSTLPRGFNVTRGASIEHSGASHKGSNSYIGPSTSDSHNRNKSESPSRESSSRGSTPRGTPTKSSPVQGTPTRDGPRRPSLTRAASFDSPSVSPRRSSLRSAVLRLRCESQDTAEEEDEEEVENVPVVNYRRQERDEEDDDEDEDDEEDEDEEDEDEEEDMSESKEPGGVMNGNGGVKGRTKGRRRGGRRDRTKVEQQRSQELDSPSNAAVPIVEAPSTRICEAAWVLRTLLLARAPHLLRDRRHRGCPQPRCGVGTEMTEWLLSLTSTVHSRSQAAGMWQSLLEEGAIYHVTGEQPFRDKYLFYRFLEDSAAAPGVPPITPSPAERRDAEDRLTPILAFLQQRAPDSMLRMILRKPSHERTIEDQELIYEELLHLKALSHLSNSVKRELASIIKFESHSREGTILFQQGSEGKSWYIILRGSVNVAIHGKGVVNTLQEGDDFGKAATIILHEDNCHFLRVDKGDFNRIMRDVEANTVRLKEHGQDVLVLEKISSNAHSHSHYNQGNSQDEEFIVACKRRVIHFVHRWVMTIKRPVFCNAAATQFLQTLQEEVAKDVEVYGVALRDEATLMLSVAEALERHERDCSSSGVSKWKLPTSGRPISLFGVPSTDDTLDPHRGMRAQDDSKGSGMTPDVSLSHPLMCSSVIFRVYCADHTYCTLRFSLQTTSDVIKRSAADKLGLRQENLLLVELKSTGEVVPLREKEVCPPTGLTLNGRLFISNKDHLDALMPLPEQEGPSEGSINQLEMYSTRELAYHITLHDWDLFSAIHEYEFLYQVFGRDHFGQVMCNLDVFLRRFNEIQYWVVTEICLANALSKRTQLLRKFIKLAAYCKEHQNLNAFFAIVIGLSNVAISRLTQTWERLSSRFRKMYTEFEMLIDPSKNHRAYRIYVAKLLPPILPFTPLLMKDMTFTHEGNRTLMEGLVNFEKMHMLAQTLRTIRYCRSRPLALEVPAVPKNENEIRVYVRNLQVIDNQRRLLVLSQRHEPKRP
ncbi:Rap guanine nucleotide exchange factor 3-like [Homarus americanus]|uniref:Rap guanine nucleotide exchange factor 3-like n=1 Tax=Homarus americanus TaxID=6706 RepID=A0A8J5TC20_HOMAM|nr:Rap guanine nucleotide exchange factor 3-like [Homarus americanus]